MIRVSAHWRFACTDCHLKNSSLHRKLTMLHRSHIKTQLVDIFCRLYVQRCLSILQGNSISVCESVLVRRQHSAGSSVSMNSSHSSPPVLAPLYHGAPCPVLSFPTELSQTRSPLRSPRRLPIPPKHATHSPSTSTSSSSSSSLSLPIQFSPSPPQSVIVH